MRAAPPPMPAEPHATHAAAPAAGGAATPPLLLALRHGTRAWHDAVEQAPALAALMQDGVTQADYIAALQGQFRFHAAYQPALAKALRRLGIAWRLPDFALAALREDITALAAPVPPVPAPPRLGRGLAPLGALYVLEGSLLGGRVIGRHIAARLRIDAGTGASFYCGTEAAAARSRWLDFCGMLRALPESEAPALIAGARDGFHFFLRAAAAPESPSQAASARARPAPAFLGGMAQP